MSASVNGRPAGTPSMTAVSASPWDSPAVRKRKISAIDETLVARRSEYHAARGDCRPQNAGPAAAYRGVGPGAGGAAPDVAAVVIDFRTDGVRKTTNSRPVSKFSFCLKR